jgi:hypothetical protein
MVVNCIKVSAAAVQMNCHINVKAMALQISSACAHPRVEHHRLPARAHW